MNEGRAALILALFVGGIVGGVVVQRATDPGVRANPYASLEKIEEPSQSAEVAAALLMIVRSHDLNRLLDKPGRRGCGTLCKYLFGDHRSESQAVASVIFTPDAARRYCNACVLIGSSLTFSPAR